MHQLNVVCRSERTIRGADEPPSKKSAHNDESSGSGINLSHDDDNMQIDNDEDGDDLYQPGKDGSFYDLMSFGKKVSK